MGICQNFRERAFHCALGKRIMKHLGLIAGNGKFPIIFAQAAKAKGTKITAVAIKEETSPDLEKYVDTRK